MNRIRDGELARKAIHYLATLIPLTYYFLLDRSTMITVMAVCFVIILIGEHLRMRRPAFRRLYLKIFGWMIRPYEYENHLTGATYVFLGALLVASLFPKEIAVIALLFLTVGDPSACLVGLSIGRIRLIGNKTLEGTLAFILAGLLATFWIPGVPFLIKIIGVTIACLVELIPWKVDDNWLIPTVSALCMYLLTLSL